MRECKGGLSVLSDPDQQARRGLGWSSFGRLLIQVKYHHIMGCLKYNQGVLGPDLTFGFAHFHSASATRHGHSCQTNQIAQTTKMVKCQYGKNGETGESGKSGESGKLGETSSSLS